MHTEQLLVLQVLQIFWHEERPFFERSLYSSSEWILYKTLLRVSSLKLRNPNNKFPDTEYTELYLCTEYTG